MLLTVLVVPVVALLAKLGLLPKEFIALASIICVIGGAMRVIYALMFEDGAKAVQRALTASAAAGAHRAVLREGRAQGALPPQQSRPATDFSRRRVETAEMAQPPSVTENTTRLLNDANNH